MLKSQETQEPTRRQFFFGWYVVAASWLMLFIFCGSAVGIFFKPMLEDFGWDRATLSSVQTVGLIVFAIASPFLGRFIDRFGARAMLFICVATQTLSGAINGSASSLWHLYVARFFYQIYTSHASGVMINNWFVKKRGLALGIFSTGVPLGTLILSPVSGYLILNWGWRPTMFFWAGVSFVIMLPLVIMLRNRPRDKGLVPDGELITSEPEAPSKIEKAAAPLTPYFEAETSEAVRTTAFWLLGITQFICGIGCGFIMTHTVIFATDVGFSDMIGATLMSVQGGVCIVGVLLTGYLSDRYARSRVLSLTHLIRGLSFATTVIFLVTGGDSLWLLYLAMGMFGFGWFATYPLSSGLTADYFGYRRMGTIFGLMLSAHMLGMAIGAYAGGWVFVQTGSYFYFFITQGCLELLAAILAFIMKRPSRP